MRFHRLYAVLLSFSVTVGSLVCPTTMKQAKAAEQTTENSEEASTDFIGLDAEYHTQEEIREYYKNHPIKKMEVQYNREPSVTAPYDLGELTEETKQDALNMLNLLRYITGVPEVSITEKAQNYAQAAAVAMAANRKLAHIVDRPEGMSKEMYDLAAYGAFNSNIAAGGNSLCNNIIRYMVEANGDIKGFGHRRQLLDYYYTEAGFGMAESVSGGTYSATFVDANLKEDKIIAYPAQNQPLEYFGTGYVWTVVVPEQVDESKVRVKITDQKTGKIWEYDNSSNSLWVDNSPNGCIMFSPYNIQYHEGDKYRVEIMGTDKMISYEVNLFLLDDPVPLERIYSSIAAYYPAEGEKYNCDVKYIPENATNKNVTWSSSDPDIAEPEWSGTGSCTVIAKKPGTAIFTATSEDGGHTAQIEITVRPKATSVTLSKTEVTIGVGQSFVLTGETFPKEARDSVSFLGNYGEHVNYDENVIDMEDDISTMGKVRITGKAVGQTTVTAYAYSDSSVRASCRVNVVEPVYTKELTLDRTEVELMSDETIQLNTQVEPSNITCKDIQWSTSDSNIVKVEDGKIIPNGGVGKAVITAKAMDGSGKEAKCTVTVYGRQIKMSAPRVQSKTFDTVVLYDFGGCEFSMDKEHWQDSSVFSGLEAGHTYTFYVRYKEMGYVKAGEASEGTVVEIPKSPYGDDWTEPTMKPTQTPTSTQSPNVTKKPSPTKKSGETENTSQSEKPTQEEPSADGKIGKIITKGSCRYRILSASTVSVTGLTNRKAVKVVIPKTVKNAGKTYKVTSIGKAAFKGCTNLSKITIEKNVTKIEVDAFRNCKKLRNITIKSTGLESVGKNAFKGIKTTVKIKVPSKRFKTYKKLLKKKGQGKKVKIVKS